jgi:CRP-like cAMP-binding protein
MSKALWGLEKLELFKGLNAMEMQEITKIATKVRYGKGDVIADQGNGRDVYVLIEGEVDIVSLGGVPLYRVAKNEGFGELAIIKNLKRTAVAVCREDSWVLVMNVNHLEQLGEEFPDIHRKVFLNLVQSLGIKLARANKLIELLKTELGKALKPHE